MEATKCRLAMTGHGSLVIVSIYLPAIKPLLWIDLEAFLALGVTVIFFGAFNCKNPRRFNPIMKITNWTKESTAHKEISTPSLNNIPNHINTTDEIDSAIGALTNHVRTVVEYNAREVPASLDH
ncbi:hypothetical protein EVAR_80942_1 [Eumeta japonica]|uniref:Uncharacterized protein n=1 Tax=Eumeta variegata TaxID=151549 RepID=A0A4C1V259_EUMVA|nr:hypothetical protein EVAR_80942_1 [Eumeta japonica]